MWFWRLLAKLPYKCSVNTDVVARAGHCTVAPHSCWGWLRYRSPKWALQCDAPLWEAARNSPRQPAGCCSIPPGFLGMSTAELVADEHNCRRWERKQWKHLKVLVAKKSPWMPQITVGMQRSLKKSWGASGSQKAIVGRTRLLEKQQSLTQLSWKWQRPGKADLKEK